MRRKKITIKSDSLRPTNARTLKATWSLDSQSLKDIWGIIGPQYPDNVLDIINDALEDPNYDPNKPYYGIPRWPDGRAATEEEIREHNPVLKMASEMSKEIDAEIIKELQAVKKKRSK